MTVYKKELIPLTKTVLFTLKKKKKGLKKNLIRDVITEGVNEIGFYAH